MKFLREGLCLAVLGAGLAATPVLQAAAAGSAPSVDNRSIVQKMKDEAKGSVTFAKEKSTGQVGFARAGVNGDLLPSFDGTAVEKADAYLDAYATAFGAAPAQLTYEGQARTAAGTTVTYTQQYQSVPVFGAMLRAHVDKGGDLTSVNGFAAPDLNLSVDPRLSAEEAGDRAVAAVTADPPTDSGQDVDVAVKGLTAKSADLVVYRTGSIRGATGENKLVYVVEVSNGTTVRDMVFVDAQTDKLVNRYSMVHDALERELYESSPSTVPIWTEGDPFPGTLNEDQQNLVNGTGESYWFFKNAFDRDSYDALGHVMKTVNNDPSIACPNANWNGTTTNYCNGVTSDDVVAHEWGHAYTEYTHNLIYQYQSGALNESYSDIWGETVDLINGRMDGDEGDIQAKRDDDACSTHTALPSTVLINTPASIAKTCESAPAQFGPGLTLAGTTGDVVLADDGDAADGSASNACTPLVNGAAIDGNIALVDRGVCGFTVKVKNAQDAGAVAVLVGDNTESTPSPLGGADPTITIPSVRIRLSDRNLIVGELANGPVNVTMKLDESDRQDSYRWLMGEDSTAFGGAIRDMWTPTCVGDPGKVTDAEYFCAPDDGGGVHSNSGVPNHGYALTVDGGTYNGIDVGAGIGLTKAAAIYFRAMTDYQTPTSDFTDHANSLAQSCVDLTGLPLTALSTAENDAVPSTETISQADCAVVGAVADAVEFRTEPVQCNFQPMFNQDRPALCSGKGRGAQTIWRESFENGIPADWDSDVESVFGHPGSPWVASAAAPTGNGNPHTGGVAYGPAPDGGNCDGTEADFSTRDGLITKIIQLPDYRLKAPKLVWSHYLATETGFDGGNVKYRLNGGAFQLIPATAYLNNGPTEIASAADGNTNPLQGEEGFTGTDGGSAFGSWGQSQVDLSMLGVAGGDEIEFRFDIGRDGCGGNDGWYIDNVSIALCKIKTKVTGVHAPQPSTFGKASKVNVSVVPDGATGTVTGKVVLRRANGTVVATATLRAGRATFTLPPSTRVGTTMMSVTYAGTNNPTYLSGSDDVKIIVKRR